MKFMSTPRFLAIYSGFLTAIFAVTILGGFAGPLKKASFDEISVQRINIDMTVAAKARHPAATRLQKRTLVTSEVLFFASYPTLCVKATAKV